MMEEGERVLSPASPVRQNIVFIPSYYYKVPKMQFNVVFVFFQGSRMAASLAPFPFRMEENFLTFLVHWQISNPGSLDQTARGRILGRNWNKSLKTCPPFYSQSPRLFLTPPPPILLSKSELKLVCNVKIVYGNLKSENSQDYARKSQRNFTFMNSASGLFILLLSRKVLKEDFFPTNI